MSVNKIHFAFATILAFACAVPVLAQRSSTPPGDAEKGATTYMEVGCYACHGTVGQGGSIAGPKLAPNPLPFFVFEAQLRNPVRAMPRYSKDLLSDQEAANIYAYLASIKAE